ncbi:MAG: carboxylating nicotinate-nucleotide diphosphorylase [Planctomycetota bacterium]
MSDLGIDDQTRADIIRLATMALEEDIGSSDLQVAMDCTTLSVVPENVPASASYVARDQGVVSGLAVAEVVIHEFAPQIRFEKWVEDGTTIQPQAKLATMHGEAQDILMLERTCLNFMCRLSGISSITSRFVEKISGLETEILDTRKTTPGWRRIEKYAVACGGGANHRMGLYDAVMIKDNHLAMYGAHIGNSKLSVSEAVELARKWVESNANKLPNGGQTVVQIEVDTVEQLKIAFTAKPDIVLLDNMSVDQLRQSVDLRNKTANGILLEASGGVNYETVRPIAETGVERISIGAITHSATNFDIGLDWEIGNAR